MNKYNLSLRKHINHTYGRLYAKNKFYVLETTAQIIYCIILHVILSNVNVLICV